MTLKAYMCNIQCPFSMEWAYQLKIMKGKIFANRENGLVAVMENSFRDQRSRGMVVRSHNLLSKEDIVKL